MCGIVGIINKYKNGFSQNQVSLFTHMLYCDAIRGFDSTGLFEVNTFGNVKWIKSRGTPPIILGNKEYTELAKKSIITGQILIGHNRKATQGTISDENAHPFIEKNIILVHNGTIFGHKDHADTEVDSHAICKLIAQEGYKEAIKRINGAFTLVWYNVAEKKLYCVRNDKRPMNILETQTSFILSSEKDLATWLISRESFNNEIKNHTDCKPGVCYTWDVNNCTNFKEESQELFIFPQTYSKTATGLGEDIWNDQDNLYETRNKYSNLPTQETYIKKKSLPLNKKLKESFKIGEEIIFTMENYTNNSKKLGNWAGILEGYTHKQSAFIIKALFTEDTWEKIADWTNIKGTILNIDLSANPHTIWLDPNSIKPHKILIDMQGQEISLDNWETLNKNCSRCNNPILFDEIPQSFVKLKPTFKSKIICPDCVDKLIAARTPINQSKSQTKDQKVALLH